jgi:Fic family protein
LTINFTIIDFGDIIPVMSKKYPPEYQLTPKLVSLITQVERLYGQIEGLRVPKKLELNLKRDNMIQSSYASNKIEGNPLTLPEVTNLLLDDRVPANRDEKEVVNYFDILGGLDKYIDEPFDLSLLKEIHLRLMDGVAEFAGKIRNEKVVIGKFQEDKNKGKDGFSLKVKHEPPFHKRVEIEGELKKLFSWANEKSELPITMQTGLFHHQMVYLHPFEDGNGRVTRLLTALLFLKRSYNINRYFILDDYYDIDRTLYSDNLHEADRGNMTAWLEYFSEGVKYSLQSAVSKFENAMKTLSIAERPTNKEREVLEIMKRQPEVTSTDVADHLKVSRQQAHNLLKSLVGKDLLERKGSTKSSYYMMR